jgi:carbamoyltransferase
VEHAYWGTSHPDGIASAGVDARLSADVVAEHRLETRRYDDVDELCGAAAALVADGCVLGWYQGRMEWGARALGNRSIVADPRRADMRDRINARIKFRERFRPFAPSVLEEHVHEYFDGAVDAFMQQVAVVRPDVRETVPAITHVDGTARAQAVSARTNPRYHALIRAFHVLTGVPMVLNTSLNENEPIVDTPAQALDCFLRTRMDAIVIHDTLVRRRGTD